MKIIDKTPLLDEKGNLGLIPRIQGMLQFGFNWPNQLEAQKAIITYFDRQLEKGYTLIRNYTLGQSGIMVPIILLGPTGIYVIHIAFERGRYEVKGDTWNVASGETYKPAPVNLIQRTMRMANAVKAFIERQGVKVPIPIEPVLIAGDPGMHIESVRPAIKVMMIDGIKSFVTNLATGRPVIGADMIYELTERIVNPRAPKKETSAPAAPRLPADEYEPPYQPEASRARAIFDAAEEAKPFNPSDFDFEMGDEASVDAATESPSMSAEQESSPAQPLPRSTRRGRRVLGMTPVQLGIIAALGVAFLCLMVVFAYLLLS